MRKATEKLARTCNILANFELSHRLAVKRKLKANYKKKYPRGVEKKKKNQEHRISP